MKLWKLHKIERPSLNHRIPLLWPTYVGEKEDNICESTWDKSEVLWRTYWGTH
jgi:hypothetical protein